MTAPIVFNDPVTYDLWRERARALCDLEGNVRFAVGDALLEAFAAFPERTTADMADDLGIASATAYERASMSATYNLEERAHWESKGLSYSLLRVARKLAEKVLINDFLNRAIAYAWTVRVAERELKMQLGETIHETPFFTGEVVFRKINGRVVIEGLEASDVKEGIKYKVTISNQNRV